MSDKVVYFVQAAIGGPIKIGVAVGLENRLKGIQNMCPIPLVCLATMPGYTLEERALHEQFASFRLHGEWFRDVPELREFILTISTGAPIEAPTVPYAHGPTVGDQWRRFVRLRAEIHAREARERQRLDMLAGEFRQTREELRALQVAVKRETHELEGMRKQLRKLREDEDKDRYCSYCGGYMDAPEDGCWDCDHCRVCRVRLPGRGSALCSACRTDAMPLVGWADGVVKRVEDLSTWFDDKRVERLGERAAKVMRKRTNHKNIAEALRLTAECLDAMCDTFSRAERQ